MFFDVFGFWDVFGMFLGCFWVFLGLGCFWMFQGVFRVFLNFGVFLDVSGCF